ncbi:C-type lectin snaclec-2 [Plakobranchus ocellatus]|uniref:C-type lectin snaclec-2 n=1 Tax=Plakobranchus ocellatus TaxID=259542 RepID=A0AAV4B9A8_9GAST|nr:C-type lectin snaclec-2 [Plakobranchus ocellatus]
MVHFFAYVVVTAFITLTAAQLECPGGFSLFESYCYFIGKAGYDFYESRDECDKRHSDLVTISSTEEREFLKSLLKDDAAKGVWIRADRVGRDRPIPLRLGLNKGLSPDVKCETLSKRRDWEREKKDCDVSNGMKFVCKTRSFARTCTRRTCFTLLPGRYYQSIGQMTCEDLGGSLASIRSKRESKVVKEYLDQVSRLENPTYQQRPDKNNRYKLLTTLP